MTHRALVVDDDKFMVRTLSDVLRLKGWEVSTAFSGEGAVEQASREHFDVILMDVKMPGMDGVDAFKAIKATRPGTRVLLMTAYAAQDRIAEAEREGVMRVIPKPVDVDALLSLLAATLANQRPVLIVDRDAAFLKTLAEVLQLRGFETILAADVDHATQLMSDRHPAAVLLHLNLSGRAAKDAVYAVHNVSPTVALILYSGQPGGEEVLESLPTNWIRAYLQKPFAVEQVTGVLDAIRNGG